MRWSGLSTTLGRGEAAELDRVVRAAHAASGGVIVDVDDLPVDVRQHREAVLHPRREATPIALEKVLAEGGARVH